MCLTRWGSDCISPKNNWKQAQILTVFVKGPWSIKIYFLIEQKMLFVCVLPAGQNSFEWNWIPEYKVVLFSLCLLNAPYQHATAILVNSAD